MSKLSANLFERGQLSKADVDAMYQLFSGYYDHTSMALFESDLAQKTHVIVLRDATRLCGFSTLSVWEHDGDAAPCRILFSGDTIIHRDYWGEQALSLAFCHFAGQLHAQQPHLPLYWFLISKGYRTYRYLHLFSKIYWPCYRDDAGSELKPLLDQVAAKKFGSYYDPVSGVIRFAQSRGQLHRDWADIRPNMRQRPEIDFFLQRNPHYAEGEELACLTQLQESNLRSVARRAFIAGTLGLPLPGQGAADV